MAQLKERALRQFTFFKGKSAGRNSAGRITIFHRGGGAKRLRRAIDLKRGNPSVGIVERIEYDPNRSSRIALVRWIQGVQMPRPKRCNAIQEFPPLMRQTGEPVAATASGVFSFSSLPGNVDQRKVSCLSPRPFGAYVVVGNPTGMPDWWKGQSGAGSNRIWSNDVALSALASVNGKGDAESISSRSASCLPRMAVAGAKPAFFAPRMREEDILKETFGLSEVQKWRTDSPIWEHRIKRQAALSWQTLQQQETTGLLAGAAEHKEKPKVDQDTLTPSELLAYALSSGRACYLNASRSLFNVSSPVEASHAGSLPSNQIGKGPKDEASKVERAPVSYITASHQLEAGKMVMNCNQPKPSASSFVQPGQKSSTYPGLRDLVNTSNKGQVEGGSQLAASQPSSFADVFDMLDFHSQVGNCLPVAEIRMGTRVHDIEVNPGQGAKLARAAGASAKLVKIVKEPALQCLVRLPSGDEKLIDSRCRATIGTVSNPNHGARKLRKAGDSRWLGRRPVVRGVAMNPVDHPHGGGEGRTKGGRPSVSPWGKPTKAGYRTASMKKRKN